LSRIETESGLHAELDHCNSDVKTKVKTKVKTSVCDEEDGEESGGMGLAWRISDLVGTSVLRTRDSTESRPHWIPQPTVGWKAHKAHLGLYSVV